MKTALRIKPKRELGTKGGPSDKQIAAAVGWIAPILRPAHESVVFVADRVVAAMKGFDVGCPRELETLYEIARLTHCHIDERHCCDSSYAPTFDPNISGVITIDILCTKAELIEQMAHELTHHILNHWEPLLTWAENAALNLLGTREQVEEMVCREVARKLTEGRW